MKLAALLAVAGLVLGVGLPLAGLGRIPLLLGAVCFVAAGILAAREARGARAIYVLGGILAAVVLLQVPGFVNDRRNGQGIAWEARAGERVVLAGEGVAVTESDDGRTVTGRDVDSGGGKWRIELPQTEALAQLVVQRVGRTLLIVDRESKLRAVDIGTGRALWDAPAQPRGFVLPAVASPDTVAVTRCREGGRCTAEARSMRDGKVRWEAPLASGAPWLGSPPLPQALGPERVPWPASAVILRLPPQGARYEVRELATGKVFARGSGDDALGVIGNLLLRSTNEGDLAAIDVTTGREAWRRRADGLLPARAPDGSLRWLGIPDGGLVMTRGLADLDSVDVGATLRVLDPRTGKLTEHPTGVRGASDTIVVSTDGPAVTARNVGAGVAPRAPVLAVWLDKRVLADGRSYRAPGLDKRDVAATPTQVGWDQRMQPFGSGERSGAVVYDRRTGKRLVRFAGEGRVNVSSAGERLVISDGSRDFVVKP